MFERALKQGALKQGGFETRGPWISIYSLINLFMFLKYIFFLVSNYFGLLHFLYLCLFLFVLFYFSCFFCFCGQKKCCCHFIFFYFYFFFHTLIKSLESLHPPPFALGSPPRFPYCNLIVVFLLNEEILNIWNSQTSKNVVKSKFFNGFGYPWQHEGMSRANIVWFLNFWSLLLLTTIFLNFVVKSKKKLLLTAFLKSKVKDFFVEQNKNDQVGGVVKSKKEGKNKGEAKNQEKHSKHGICFFKQ